MKATRWQKGRRGWQAATVAFVAASLVAALAPTAISAHTKSARPDATPYDGLIFRFIGNAATGTSGGDFACPSFDGLPVIGSSTGLITQPHLPVTVLQPVRTNPVSAYAFIWLDSGVPAVIGGMAYISEKPLHTLWFTSEYAMVTGKSADCVPPKAIASSAAGTVYPIFWTECVPSQGGGCGGGPYSETGCVAATWTQLRIAFTIEIGPCTPSAFPSLPTGWDSPMTPQANLVFIKPYEVQHPDGTVTLDAIVREGGTVTVQGAAIKTAKSSRSNDGVIPIRLRLVHALKHGATLRIRLAVTFKPRGGGPAISKTVSVKFHKA